MLTVIMPTRIEDRLKYSTLTLLTTITILMQGHQLTLCFIKVLQTSPLYVMNV